MSEVHITNFVMAGRSWPMSVKIFVIFGTTKAIMNVMTPMATSIMITG